MKWIATLCTLCALAVGCDSGNSSGNQTLQGTQWRLVAWSFSSQNPTNYTITADFNNSQISGNSAVNSYGGSYSTSASGNFSVGEVGGTEIAGSPDAMLAESRYYELLLQARKYSVTETTLTLRNDGNQELLIFTAQ